MAARLLLLLALIPLGSRAQELLVAANALVFESHSRGDTLWAARNEYTLRRGADGDLRMARKKVMLVNNSTALYYMAFLI